MSKEQKFTLIMNGLSQCEAKEIAENGSSFMWGRESGKLVAYPSSNDHPAIIQEGCITDPMNDDQRLEFVTVLQSIAFGHSDDAEHDAAVLLKKMSGELPGFGESFKLPENIFQGKIDGL